MQKGGLVSESLQDPTFSEFFVFQQIIIILFKKFFFRGGGSKFVGKKTCHIFYIMKLEGKKIFKLKNNNNTNPKSSIHWKAFYE
jgi:hypothetical protein